MVRLKTINGTRYAIRAEVICLAPGQWRASAIASRDGADDRAEFVKGFTGRITSRDSARTELKTLRAQLLREIGNDGT